MIVNDIIIFVNDEGSTRSFKRMDNGYWKSENFEGYPTDTDIRNIIEEERLFILIRGGFIVRTNLTQVRQTAVPVN